jgi:hypothetical protein
MTSELKVDKITPASGTNTQIGEAGDTTNLSAGTVTLPTSIITGASEKTTLADADKFLIADSADSNAFKHVQKSNLPSGGLTLLGTIESTSDVSTVALDSIMDNTSYAAYKVVALLKIGSNGVTLRARFRDGGSALTASNYNFANLSIQQGESNPSISSSASSDHAYITDNAGTRTLSFQGMIFPVGLISNMGISICDWTAKISNYDSGDRHCRKITGVFEFVNATVPDGFQFYLGSGNFEDYEMRIYGVSR